MKEGEAARLKRKEKFDSPPFTVDIDYILVFQYFLNFFMLINHFSTNLTIRIKLKKLNMKQKIR